jgi:hypothetical protein
MKTSPFTVNAFQPVWENHPPGEFRRSPFASPLSRAQKGGKGRTGARLLPATAVILIAAMLLTQSAFADEALLRGPRQAFRVVPEAVDPSGGKQGILEKIVSAPVLFYQRFMGPHWGQRCAYYPSCSNYALLAIRKHGAVIGTIMIFDRFQHESNEAKYSPRILAGEEIRVYDPLENNDYWWYSMQVEAAAPVNAEMKN